MKWFLFFIAIFFLSCSNNSPATKKSSNTLVDRIKPATDTAIAPFKDWKVDSIQIAKERDSFYSIPPLRIFTDSQDSLAEEKIVSLFIDSSGISSIPNNFTRKAYRKYNKQQLPISETLTYTSKQYTIKVVNDNIEDWGPKKIYINGKRLRAGKDLDTTKVSGYFYEWIEFDPEYFRELSYNNRNVLYMRGHIEKCNGTGCGVSFHVLYDPLLHKAVAIEHYRVTDFFIGAIPGTRSYSFLCFEPFEYNQLFNNIPYSAKLYAFTANGKLSTVKNKKGEACYFVGYTPNGESNIIIQEAAFP